MPKRVHTLAQLRAAMAHALEANEPMQALQDRLGVNAVSAKRVATSPAFQGQGAGLRLDDGSTS